jgi:hypothetical protein
MVILLKRLTQSYILYITICKIHRKVEEKTKKNRLTSNLLKYASPVTIFDQDPTFD